MIHACLSGALVVMLVYIFLMKSVGLKLPTAPMLVWVVVSHWIASRHPYGLALCTDLLGFAAHQTPTRVRACAGLECSCLVAGCGALCFTQWLFQSVALTHVS